MFNKFYKIFTIAQEQDSDFYEAFQYAIESTIYTDEINTNQEVLPSLEISTDEMAKDKPTDDPMREAEEGGGGKKKKSCLKKKTKKKHKKKYNGGRTVRTKRTGQNHKKNEKTKKKNNKKKVNKKKKK